MNNFHPLVSIIIPVYNGSNYLQCAIDSALAQDYDNIEVIVVNDGSTDNTDEIAKGYGDKIRYFFKQNGGVATALNMAIQNANGEYISWLSHDDYYLPNKISRQVEELAKLNNRENLIIISDSKIHKVHNGQEINIGNYFKTPPHVSSLLTKNESIKLLLKWEFHGCSLLIPKTAFYDVNYFDENLITTQDYDLWFKLIWKGYQFYCLPEVVMITRTHEQQGTIQKWNIVKYEQLKLWKDVNKMLQEDITMDDNETQSLIRDKIIFFRKAVREDKFPYSIAKIKKLIPNNIKKFLKQILRGL